MKGWMYILECVDGSYYTGSTIDLERRFLQHTNGEGANHTKNRLPVKLVYFEEYSRIDTAFYREKQVQRWRREKKEALIRGEFKKLPELASRTSANNREPQPTIENLSQQSRTSANNREPEQKFDLIRLLRLSKQN